MADTSELPLTWSVFILQNPAGRFFVGHIEHLDTFLTASDETVAKWTGHLGPWPLVWRHDGLSEAAARKYEISLKRDKGTPRFYSRTGLKAPETTDGTDPNAASAPAVPPKKSGGSNRGSA